PDRSRRQLQAHYCPDAIAVTSRSNRSDLQILVRIPRVVAPQKSRAAIGGHEHVQIAVVIDVAVSSASRYARRFQTGTHERRDFCKLFVAAIVKQMRRLGIGDALL